MLLGVHASIAGGLHNAPAEARTVYDAECVQIFSKNQRQWKAKDMTDDEVVLFKAAAREHEYDLKHIFAHASYLPNLGNPEAGMWKRSIEALGDEVTRATRLGILGVCFHPGSHVGEGEEWGLKRIRDGIEKVLAGTSEGALLMIECTAGTGSNLGYDPEHLGFWLAKLPDERVAVTLDTCHLFAAGYDLRGETYDATMEALDDAFGLDRVRAWHLNDSQHELGSRKDRHQRVGSGKMGKAGFEKLVNDKRWKGVPASLETEVEDYKPSLKVLRALRKATP